MTGTVAANPQEPAIAPAGRFSLTALASLFGLTLRQYRHGKRWIVIAALLLLPVALVILVRATAHYVPYVGVEFIFVFMLIPQALLPLVALIYGSGMIQDEIEDQTITYLLVRPMSKWEIYLVKLLATLTAAVILTVVFTILTYAAIYVGAPKSDINVPLRCLQACAIHSLAVVAYCCIFGLISVITRRTLIAGILYILIFEGLLANLPFGIRLLTVIYYARIIAYRTMPFVVPTPQGPQNFAADAWQLDIQNDPHLLEHPTIRTCLIVMLVGSALCAALAAFICSRREFHVKTPEKG